MLNYFKDWNIFEKSWLVMFTAIEFYLFFAWNDSVIGLVTMLTGIWCVVLVAKGKKFNYYPGIINVVLYAYISYQSKLYGEVMLNALYFLPMQFYGLWLWNKNMADQNDNVKITMMSNRNRVLLLAISAVSVYGYGLILEYLKGNFPFVDSTSTVLSVIAMLLMCFRYGEQWLLWIFVDIVSVIMWVGIYLQDGTGLSMIVMWSAYLINALYGQYNWYKMHNKQRLAYA
jgi:nicotinamide mononucleotide transporter